MKWSFAGLTSLILLSSGCSDVREGTLSGQEWQQYKAMFVTNGAVRDTGNGNVSHSEGQGYGMLIAEAYNDQAQFDAMWQWTKEHLQVREDKLFSWRWHPEDGIEDPNNATDGDVLIAWALVRAASRWDKPEYHRAAMEVLADIKRLLVRDINGYPVLLPGEYGFADDKGFELNLAYWVFPALNTFASVDSKGPWQALVSSGRYLAKNAEFGRYQLPADWIYWENGREPVPSPKRPALFGYEVIRVPLYLVWGKLDQSPLLARFSAYWDNYDASQVPAWVALDSTEIADYPAPAGFDAIHRLVLRATNAEESGDASVDLSSSVTNQDYYSASLSLLARIAMNERFNQ